MENHKLKQIDNIPVNVYSSLVFNNMKDYIVDLELCLNMWIAIVSEIEKIILSDKNNKTKIEEIKYCIWSD